MRGEGGVAGEGRVVGVQVHHAINEYQLGLDVQRFLWPVYYIKLFILYYITSKVNTPQDAHKQYCCRFSLAQRLYKISTIYT